MENPDIDRPAVHIGFPFFAALFVASFFGAPFAAVSAVFLFVTVFLLFLFKQHRQRPNFVLSLIATAAAFAVFAVAMNLFVLPTERYDGGTYTVTGNVESFLTKSNGRFYYKLHVTHIDGACTGCRFFGAPLPQRGFPGRDWRHGHVRSEVLRV